jgi:hypothetical protein
MHMCDKIGLLFRQTKDELQQCCAHNQASKQAIKQAINQSISKQLVTAVVVVVAWHGMAWHGIPDWFA